VDAERYSLHGRCTPIPKFPQSQINVPQDDKFEAISHNLRVSNQKSQNQKSDILLPSLRQNYHPRCFSNIVRPEFIVAKHFGDLHVLECKHVGKIAEA
jgi:hypothetical protein